MNLTCITSQSITYILPEQYYSFSSQYFLHFSLKRLWKLQASWANGVLQEIFLVSISEVCRNRCVFRFYISFVELCFSFRPDVSLFRTVSYFIRLFSDLIFELLIVNYLWNKSHWTESINKLQKNSQKVKIFKWFCCQTILLPTQKPLVHLPEGASS